MIRPRRPPRDAGTPGTAGTAGAFLSGGGERGALRVFEQAPGFMAPLRGPEHVFELTNAADRGLRGHRDLIGRPVREVVPEAEGQGLFERLDRACATGEPCCGHRRRGRGRDGPGARTRRCARSTSR